MVGKNKKIGAKVSVNFEKTKIFVSLSYLCVAGGKGCRWLDRMEYWNVVLRGHFSSAGGDGGF